MTLTCARLSCGGDDVTTCCRLGPSVVAKSARASGREDLR